MFGPVCCLYISVGEASVKSGQGKVRDTVDKKLNCQECFNLLLWKLSLFFFPKVKKEIKGEQEKGDI